MRDLYSLAVGQYRTSHGYRLLWIRSTQKTQQDAEIRQRYIEKALDALKKLQTSLNTYKLKTWKNIQEKITAILKQNKCLNLIFYEIHRNLDFKSRHTKAGRPSTADSGTSVEQEQFSVSFRLNDNRIRQEAFTDEVFSLITNLKNQTSKNIHIVPQWRALARGASGLRYSTKRNWNTDRALCTNNRKTETERSGDRSKGTGHRLFWDHPRQRSR
jgi:hypothetical protein